MSPKEVEFLDPQQRFLLEVTWEAFEDAMIDPLTLRGSKTGVFVGSWIHDYKEICGQSVDLDFFRQYMGNSIGSTAARLSHFFQTTGPSVGTESGCSSTIAAVDMACKSLRNRDSDVAIAAGVNLLLHPFDVNVMEFVFSPDFRCKTFDAEGNGFARAEGCASIIMKRLSDAVKDGDNIWGLIRGSALTQEGLSKSLGTPTVHSESMAMELALQDAGVEPNEVSFVEAHGTGTAVGDPLEILSIQKIYSKGRTEPLVIGSVKTNIGHTESVSGLTGIIKVLLSMKNEMIPKHLNLNTLNPRIKLEVIPARIPLEPVPWPRNGKKRIAGVSSFGISGTDGHAIIEEPPHIHQPCLEFNDERPLHIMKFSAKSKESMNELVQKYQNMFLEKIEDERNFADIAYSANVGRVTFNHRAVIIAKNLKDAGKILHDKSFKQADVQVTTKNLCFLFTGQGSQYSGMGKQLYETSPVFRDYFDKCDKILQRRYNIFIKNVLWSSDGNGEELNRTLYSQTSIFVVEYCLLKLWESWGVKPDYVIGHSLGEFAAAVAAGALHFEDAIMLVAERSRLIDYLPRGKMLVIKADKKTFDERISEFYKINPEFWVDYAALNSPDQTVVAGDPEMIHEFGEFCTRKSLKTIILAATHAFHSRHMEPMLDAYRKVASTVRKPEVEENQPKYISGMEGKLMKVDEIDTDYWVRHTREQVNFMKACKAVQEEGCSLFLEVGPHPVLSALTMMNMACTSHQITCLPSFRKKENEWVTMLDTLSKLYLSDWKGEIDWKGFDRFYTREKVKLPFYPFNRKSIWAKFERKYTKLHPLIGTLMPTASNDTIFQSPLTLKNTAFAQDHVIGNTVVFPGAGFLEMCLTGGHSTAQGFTENLVKPRRPVLLKKLKIASPLALHESCVCRLQTVVTMNDKVDDDSEVGYSVEIHRQAENNYGTETGRWILHSSAKFLPVAPTSSSEATVSHDITTMISTWKKSDNRNFYDKLPEVGLRFGPKFHSLECIWKSENGLLASIKVPEDYRDYLIHPVVADAMIQIIMIWNIKDNFNKKLHVPIMIDEFIWLKEPNGSNLYAFCSTDENNDTFCALVDDIGTTFAVMKGVEFIETTAKLLEGMITQQSSAMPKLWKEIWKSSRGPLQGCLTHEMRTEEQEFNDEDLKYFENGNLLSQDELNFYLNLVNITRLGILKALYELGWKPELGLKFSINYLMSTLKIKDNFKEYIRFFMRSMASEKCSLLKSLDEEENTFKFVSGPPTKEEIELGLKHTTSFDDVKQEEYRMIMEIQGELAQILMGNLDPLSILFPQQDSTKPSAAKYYENLRKKVPVRPFQMRLRAHVIPNVERYCSYESQLTRPTCRFLEVGAGTGVATKVLISDIVECVGDRCDFEFYITDISAVFFISAEENLQEYMEHVVFKKYDRIFRKYEKDPLEQGFCPGYFDVIYAAEVFHIAKDVKKTMRMVRSLLKPGGLLLTAETIHPDERNTFVFGLLNAYWQFEDTEFRKNHVTLTPQMWEETLSSSGFEQIRFIPFYNNILGMISAHAAHVENNFLKNISQPKHSWIIFGEHDDFTQGISQKLQNVNRKTIVVPKPKADRFEEMAIQQYFKNAIASASDGVDFVEGVLYLWSLNPDTRDQTQVSLPFVTLMQLVGELKVPPKAFAIVRGAHAMDSYDVIDPTPATLVGLCKSLANENKASNVNCLDLDPNKDVFDQQEEIFTNLWVEHHMGAAFRDGLRFRPKLTVGKVLKDEPLSLPSGCDRFQLVLPKTRLISDLEFAYLEPYKLGEKEVEIQVKAIALNFRDVFTVLKPIPVFESFNAVGLDVSGIVVKAGKNVTKFKIGDKVIGTNMEKNLSLPSHFKNHQDRICPLDKSMTFTEGVTLPAVFSTAVYCLSYVAKMKKGETVLIHTASGGVGLIAIQLCKYFGANVIATAGSERKRTYLRNLGIQHVFHSRTTDFKKDILETTGGRGVDIVLNSLTGPGFKEASLDVLTKNGRFIEMSKLNVWTSDEVRALRPDAFYKCVDLSELGDHEQDNLTKELQKLLQSGFVKPIAYERFDALNIRGALKYLQKASHIGKIVCIMPEVKLQKSRLITTTPLFNEDSTYMVTGGLGGIGFEIVRWMLMNGAKHVVIVSRSSPKQEIAAQIENWNKSGKHVQSFSADVGNYQKCKELLKELKKPEFGFPQLRGVMHAAGVLHDGVLENQSWDTFQHTYNPKVHGSWNLHDLTKDSLLEHFVLFSSITATFGSPAQTNHSASNAFEDSLAAYRRSIGLPATSINWGNWGEVGVATEIDFPGVRPLSTSQGLLALEKLLRTQTNHMSVVNIESFALMLKLFPEAKHYVDDYLLMGDCQAPVILNSDEFWSKVDSASDEKEKVECFKKLTETIVRNILKMDADEPINYQEEFQILGIDSLMMLEMKNSMQNILGERMTLTANHLKDCNSTEALANRLVDILEGTLDDDKNKNLPSHEELKQLIRDDSNLLPDSLSVENIERKSIDQVESVLLTGSIGNLGPCLLSELTRRQQIKKVYCLISSTTKESSEDRLKRRLLEEGNISDAVDFSKIEIIDGDITTPKFGLSEKLYENLCENVDAVIHNAERADHTANYWKAPETNESHIRTVNVLGTLKVLQFAAERKVKHFFHSSTIFAYTGMGKGHQSDSDPEGWQDVSAFDSLKNAGNAGYVVTKHISEQLVHSALGKGIPCKAFRFPFITGYSKAGREGYLRNPLILRWLTCMKIGIIHDFPVLMATLPVDHCAKISLDIFFNPDAPNDVYNIVPKQVAVEQVFVEVAQQFSNEMETLTYREFVEMLKVEGKNENSPIAPFTKFFMGLESSEFTDNSENPSIQELKKCLENRKNWIDTSKLTKFAAEYEHIDESRNQILSRDFEYFKSMGVFEKFGIKCEHNDVSI